MKLWLEDIRTARVKDPASRSFWQVALTYKGVCALRMHRRAHKLYKHGHYLWASRVAHACCVRTGIEIHPGATIGRRCFIDHGVGVVIGETAVVGDDVIIYQGVTLGGTGKDTGKRHPTVQDRVLLAAGSSVLGPIVIGHDSKIGAGSVVLKNVPPFSTVVGIPGRVVKTNNIRIADLDQINIPDPVLDEFRRLNERIFALEQQLGVHACRYSMATQSDNNMPIDSEYKLGEESKDTTESKELHKED